MNPYLPKNAPTTKRIRPLATRRPEITRGFPLVGNGLGGLPVRKSEPPDAWVLTVDITAGGQSYTVDIEAGTGIDVTIDWGDGLIQRFTTTGEKSRTYNSPGIYYVRITGKFASSGNIHLSRGTPSRLKATSIIPFIPGLLNFSSTFLNCTGLTSLPDDLFRYNTAVSTSGFNSTFYGCTSLTSLPVDLFRYNTLVSTSGFDSTFYGCTGLTSLPVDLFRYNTEAAADGFSATFRRCTGLTSLPDDLFRYNTKVSSNAFLYTFAQCAGLTSLPNDLFRYNTNVSTRVFNATFIDCTNITTLPNDLFRYNTEVTTEAFRDTFYGCTSLISLPGDLFKYNTKAVEFYRTFTECTALASLPAQLFKYNTACTTFYKVFQYCYKLQLRADIFFDPGEEGTRFLNKTVNFQYAFQIGTFTGTQGTAPALWTCSFGTGTPAKTSCFTGHTTSSVDNHAAIVADGTWGLS